MHEGHRERMRERFFRFGLETFNEIEALEFLLQFALPRRDTNPLAHTLLDRFGGLNEVLAASEQELCEVPGVGENTAALLMLLPQMSRRCELAKAARIKTVAETEDAAAFLIPRFRGEQDESMVMLCLDAQRRISHTETVSKGVVNVVPFDARRIVEIALKRKADSVVLAHNHPNGPLRPSREDDAATELTFRALEMVGIKLYDHLIICDDEYFSYRRSGTLGLCRYRY